HDLREAADDRVALAFAEMQEVAEQGLHRDRGIRAGKVARHRSEVGLFARCEYCRYGNDVVPHHAVADGPAAAGDVARHATYGCSRCGRDIDGKPQAMRLELPVQVVQDYSRLDDAAAAFDIARDHPVEMPGDIHDQRLVNRLARLRGAVPARLYREPFVTGGRHRAPDVVHGPRHHHREWHHLIDRGIRRITAAHERIEVDLAFDFASEAALEGRSDQSDHQFALDGNRNSDFDLAATRQAAQAEPFGARIWGNSNPRRRIDHGGPSLPADTWSDQRARPGAAGNRPANHRPSRTRVRRTRPSCIAGAQADLRLHRPGRDLSIFGYRSL